MIMLKKWRWIHDFVGLFYPNLCVACGQNLPPFDDLLCLKCQFELPETKYHQQPENAFVERFWGRVPIESGAALYYYNKGSRVQHLIHLLKYQNKPEIGYKLGLLYGKQLRQAENYTTIEAVVPVPLHPKKAHARGYNQAEQFSRGLAESMEIIHLPKALRRKSFTVTQTKKSRIERLENVLSAFEVVQHKKIANKHILLVDDVMTTGATLEACTLKLQEVEEVKISLATIAIASD